MVEGTNTNSARKSGNTKILSAIFCILLVSMVGLIVANVIIHFMGGKGDSGEPEETFLRGNMIPPELVQSLLLSKKFHEAALRPSAFYY